MSSQATAGVQIDCTSRGGSGVSSDARVAMARKTEG